LAELKVSEEQHEFYSQIIKTIIEKGADINAQDTLGNTPLHIATEKENIIAEGLFKELGASTIIQNKYIQLLYFIKVLGRMLTFILLLSGKEKYPFLLNNAHCQSSQEDGQ
jgi:ankyrin repeat protein